MESDGDRARQFLSNLIKPLQRRPREAVLQRYDAMLRELRFRSENKDQALGYLRGRGWVDQRFFVLFALNCVYQEILGPLQASSRSGIAGLGTEHPIIHGTKRFDAAQAARVEFAILDFMAMVSVLRFSREWLHTNTCGDLIFYIERYERESEPRG